MRRRDFTIGLLLAAATQPVRAQERAAQHRIAIVIPAGPVARISDTEQVPLGGRFWRSCAGWAMSRDKTSPSSGIPARGGPRLCRSRSRGRRRNPDVIVPISNSITLAVSAATSTIPIVASGAYYISLGAVPSLARPAGNMTGVRVIAGSEIYGKYLQILKEAVPSACRPTTLVEKLTMRPPLRRRRDASRNALKVPFKFTAT